MHLSRRNWEQREGLWAPLLQPQPAPCVGSSHFPRCPSSVSELAKEPFQRGVLGPGSWPACHAAAGHPFLKHLLVEATGSRPLCHGSCTGRPAASLEFMMVDRVGVPSSPALRRPEGPLGVNFLSPYCSWGMSPERGCGSPKAAGQFRVEVELEPGAPSVFLRNQQDCPRRHHG